MRKKGFNLVHIFSILSAISIVTVALISGYLITRFEEKNMIEMDVNDTVNFVRSIIREEKTPFIFHDPAKNSHIYNLILSLPEIVRVKIFDRDK